MRRVDWRAKFCGFPGPKRRRAWALGLGHPANRTLLQVFEFCPDSRSYARKRRLHGPKILGEWFGDCALVYIGKGSDRAPVLRTDEALSKATTH